jgi:gliding motility-associated-like protein
MKVGLLLLCILGVFSINAQNLIPDPGFEDIIECPKLYEFDKLRHWRQASSTGADSSNTSQFGLLYHKCGGRVPGTGWGYYDTHKGDGMGSIVAYFIYTKLKEPLIKGRSYRLSFWIRVGSKKNIGCWWQTYNEKLSAFTYKDKPLDTIVGSIRQPPIHVWSINEPYDSSWVRFEGCFKATNNDAYLGIGYRNTFLNLACDALKEVEEYRPPFLSVESKYAFRQLPFFIDDVELELAEENILPIVNTPAYVCPDSSITLNAEEFVNKKALENRFNFLWNNNDTKPKITIDRAGEYSVTIKDVCTTKKVIFNVKNKNCYCNIFVPNVFSPNNDNVNDVFNPLISCSDAVLSNYELVIYGRWGNPIFKTNDITNGWDGTVNNLKISSGVYVWTIRYDIKIGRKTQTFLESGDINIR